MNVGMVGLGRMGSAMVEGLRGQGLDLIGWDHDNAAGERAKAAGFASPPMRAKSPPHPTSSFPASPRTTVRSAFSPGPTVFCRRT
jgi:UDP-N-acetylmuramoylalanine-D-glutamate ligase